ncbi:MAG: hypothetical protein MJK04_08940 [Psychrosphaera sp.]|nr:hypothetical protein [Psychrosphaera sp.]
MTTQTRMDWAWLENTYWYCPVECMPAIQTADGETFNWAGDQTVWHITGYKGGYFWGITAALLTGVGEQPDTTNINQATFFGTITPEGQVYMTFLTDPQNTLGLGRVTTYLDQQSFEMQMTSGIASAQVVHWAYMLPITPDDPQWDDLPGVGISVPAMLEGIEPPQVQGATESEGDSESTT